MSAARRERATIRDLLHEGQQLLQDAGVETARLDAEVLLMRILGVHRAGLYLAYPDPVPSERAEVFLGWIARRADGEPVAYITGHREFMGLDFVVDARVLIPRPETEYLVEWALERVQRWRGRRRRVIDVGTGSGAIAVSLAQRAGAEAPCVIVGSDRSWDALQVARVNADQLAPGRVQIVCGDLLSWCRGGIDLLLANLPYLRPDQAHPGISREPAAALYADPSGFELYRQLLAQAETLLNPDGALLCEIDPAQGDIARETASQHFPGQRVTVASDLAGWDRYLIVDTASPNPSPRD